METAIAPVNRPAAVKALPTKVRVPYICGPITSTHPHETITRELFRHLAKTCTGVFGHYGWVPHDHLSGLTDKAACERVRRQIVECTSIMLVWAPPRAQSWGGGIAVEMAFNCGIPIVLFWYPDGFRPSPQLLGHPGILAKIVMTLPEVLPDDLETILQQTLKDNHILLKGGEVVAPEPPRA